MPMTHLTCVPPCARHGLARRTPRRAAAVTRTALLAGLVAALSACGGGGSNPLDNPESIDNPETTGGEQLSYAYFQRCVEPIFTEPLPVTIDGRTTTNTCASGGCHDTTTGTGGALRLNASAEVLTLADAANTPDVLRASEMYRNFVSAQAASQIGAPDHSRLLNKPLVRGTLHGGGLIFDSADDPLARVIAYWISHPMPEGEDEFSTAGAALFTPADPDTGECNVE